MAGVPTNEKLTLGRKLKNFVFSTEWITATIAGTRFLPPSILAVDPTVSIDHGVLWFGFTCLSCGSEVGTKTQKCHTDSCANPWEDISPIMAPIDRQSPDSPMPPDLS
jgi:hypothetical protein